jgi:hypothetical protein
MKIKNSQDDEMDFD